MKYWKKILLTGILIPFVLFSLIFLFIFFKGKDIFIKKLEALTHKKVTLDYIYLSLPFNLVAKNLAIQGQAKIEELSVSPSVFYLLFGKIVFNRIRLIKPQITYQRIPPAISPALSGSGNLEDIKETPSTISFIEPKHKRKDIFRFILKRLEIKDGNLTLIDHTAGPSGVKITIKDISFNLTDLYLYPVSVVTNFELKGKIPWRKGKEGEIAIAGWLNLYKKDMQASLKIASIDGVYLHPYYANWVDLEKARIESATLNFTSNITSLNNNLAAECHLELSDIVRKARLPEEEVKKAERVTDAVLDIFRALGQGKVVLDFTIRTKMDSPQFGFDSIKMAFENKLANAKNGKGFNLGNILLFPAKFIEGAVKGAVDLSKALIEGVFGVGKEFKKAVENTLEKEEAPSKEK
ncbi:MAG: DUF748 domain-containing protein [Candidatus Omnitrophota bacterium]|nr:DUF748 domain-containing protein [Candidatus Omnitrophota bacterium]